TAPVRRARASHRPGRTRQQVRAVGRSEVERANGARDPFSRGWPSARARWLQSLMADGEHVPVLLDEVLSALAIDPDGVYVDATFGRGGHARAILERLRAPGRLVALDRDPDAEQSARAIDNPRFVFRRCWFSEFADALAPLGIDRIDGFLLDLGV